MPDKRIELGGRGTKISVAGDHHFPPSQLVSSGAYC